MTCEQENETGTKGEEEEGKIVECGLCNLSFSPVVPP